MATKSQNLQAKRSILPDGAIIFFNKRFRELTGVFIALFAFSVCFALMSYNPTDPSLNTAANKLFSNWLGLPGALVSDFLFQTVGIASFLLPAILVAWSWQILRHKVLKRKWIRITMLPVSLFLATISLAGADVGADWPLKSGYGGIIGDITLDSVVAWKELQQFISGEAFCFFAGFFCFCTLYSAVGFSIKEWGRLGSIVFWFTGGNKVPNTRNIPMKFKLGKWTKQKTKKSISKAGFRREPKLRRQNSTENKTGSKIPIHFKGEPFSKHRNSKQPADGNNEIVEARNEKPRPGKRAQASRQPSFDLDFPEAYSLPDMTLLEDVISYHRESKTEQDGLAKNAQMLETVLQDFGVNGSVLKVRPGPVVTLYEFEPAPGIKSSRIIGLADDIARSMSAVSARVAVISGRNVIGIELPNTDREIVSLRELLESESLEKSSSNLSLALGKDISGRPTIANLARMPHLLIAGTTGSGKSVAINTMIISLLYQLSPKQCRMIMIDPKMLELSSYDGIPHLLCPVVTDAKKAVIALRWMVREMEERYRAMSTMGVRNIAGYNARLEEAKKNGEVLTETIQTGFNAETGEPNYEEKSLDMTPLPFIVVIVDEMADLMLVAGKEVEGAVQRIAQMARAAGIHLIMATQRPSVDVITGTIKANFPNRISFQVTSKIDSRTILGESGAEQLLGHGDMLYMSGGGRIVRVHGPLVTDHEVHRIVSYLKTQAEPEFRKEITEEGPDTTLDSDGSNNKVSDALYDQAVALVCRERKASTSFVQRHLQIGYNRAARIIDQMEAEDVISSANHVGKREVLAHNIVNKPN